VDAGKIVVVTPWLPEPWVHGLERYVPKQLRLRPAKSTPTRAPPGTSTIRSGLAPSRIAPSDIPRSARTLERERFSRRDNAPSCSSTPNIRARTRVSAQVAESYGNVERSHIDGRHRLPSKRGNDPRRSSRGPTAHDGRVGRYTGRDHPVDLAEIRPPATVSGDRLLPVVSVGVESPCHAIPRPLAKGANHSLLRCRTSSRGPYRSRIRDCP
jgi:hypothetical protein